MKAIGGYFELETVPATPYHSEAMALNTGRNALEYILRVHKFRKIYLPYYTCPVLLQPLRRLGVEVAYYFINYQLEPVFDFETIETDAAFLYTNYYGLKEAFVKELQTRVKSLIVDNAQAFFSKPADTSSAFYSPRKFFGVPDGGYAYTSGTLPDPLPTDSSYQRFEHLLRRTDQSAEAGYPFFSANDQALDDNPIRKMSALTQKLLAGISYETCAAIRQQNFRNLHEALKPYNRLHLPLTAGAVPMVYPFLTQNGPDLRERLISNRIYVAQYWPELLRQGRSGTVEQDLAANLVPLPIDQRMTAIDLTTLKNLIIDAY